MVKSGDVLNKVSHKLGVPLELLIFTNKLDGSGLRIGQKLYWMPGPFTVEVERKAAKVVVYRKGEFFAQAPITSVQGHAVVGPLKKGKYTVTPVKVHDKPAYKDGQRISTTDRGYASAFHWVVMSPSGHTIFAEPGAGATAQRPSTGYGVDPEFVRQLSVLLPKDDTVTIR